MRYFERIKKSRTPQQPAVVIDMFGGIGSGLVVLKKLQIAMKKVCTQYYHVCFVFEVPMMRV